MALLSKGFTQRHHQSTHFSFFRGPAAAAAAIASLPPSSHRCHRLTATLYGGKHQTTREGLWRSLRPRGKRFADQMMCNCVGLRDGMTKEHRTRSERTTHSLQASSVGHTQAMKFFVTGCQMAGLLGGLGHPPISLSITPVTKNFMAWVWPTELAWSECVVRSLRVRCSLVIPSRSPTQLHIIWSAKRFPRGRRERHNPSLVVWCLPPYRVAVSRWQR